MMFDNIGGKIKTLAKICSWVIIVSCAITGLVVMFSESFFIGLLTIVLGALIGWISAFMMYGFGELVESAMVLRDAELNRQQQDGHASRAASTVSTRPQSGFSLSALASRAGNNASWVCKCGKHNSDSSPICTDCGSSRRDAVGLLPAANQAPAAQSAPARPQTGWRCKKCGKMNATTAMFCSDCGQDR